MAHASSRVRVPWNAGMTAPRPCRMTRVRYESGRVACQVVFVKSGTSGMSQTPRPSTPWQRMQYRLKRFMTTLLSCSGLRIQYHAPPVSMLEMSPGPGVWYWWCCRQKRCGQVFPHSQPASAVRVAVVAAKSAAQHAIAHHAFLARSDNFRRSLGSISPIGTKDLVTLKLLSGAGDRRLGDGGSPGVRLGRRLHWRSTARPGLLPGPRFCDDPKHLTFDANFWRGRKGHPCFPGARKWVAPSALRPLPLCVLPRRARPPSSR